MINPLYSNIGKGNKKVIAKVLQALKENYGMVTDEKYLERVIGHCKDCKYFEYDSVAKVNRIPLIIAHEICLRWGDGCKTREDGYCFLFEPKENLDIKDNEDKERYQELEEQLNGALLSLSKSNGNLNEYLMEKEDKTDAVEKKAK